MKELKDILSNNKKWAGDRVKEDPDFFLRLAKSQQPKYLWIGCSDSRVPANEILGLPPGEVFVHRNIANLVVQTDLNCLSVMEYAVHFLKVPKIIVCGHYGCGGVAAAMEPQSLGLMDHWLVKIRETIQLHQKTLAPLAAKEEKAARLCELNVIEQVDEICRTSIVQKAWARGQQLSIHGLIYDIHNGVLNCLKSRFTSEEALDPPFKVRF